MALAIPSPVSRAAVVYVGVSLGTNAPTDGTSWATAFTNVQESIDAAANGDAVWVAGGPYFENITLKSGVALFGGFAGSETNLSQRDWTRNVTVLDGRQSNSVVVVQAGATNQTRIDGFYRTLEWP